MYECHKFMTNAHFFYQLTIANCESSFKVLHGICVYLSVDDMIDALGKFSK